MVTISSSQTVSPEVEQYLKAKGGDTSNQSIFTIDTERITSGSTIIQATDDQLVGVLVTKRIQIDKKPFTSIIFNEADSSTIASDLVQQLVDTHKQSASNGLISEPVPKGNAFISVYKKYQFKPFAQVFAAKRTKGSSSSSSLIAFVPLTLSNKSEYSSSLMRCLTEFDANLFKGMNKTLGEPAYPVNTNNRAYQIKLSYFIATLLKSNDWYTMMIVYDEEPIGFIKGKVRTGGTICDVDIFLPDQYLNKHTDKAIQAFSRYVRSTVEYLVFTAYDQDDRSMTIGTRFGNQIGSSFALT